MLINDEIKTTMDSVWFILLIVTLRSGISLNGCSSSGYFNMIHIKMAKISIYPYQMKALSSFFESKIFFSFIAQTMEKISVIANSMTELYLCTLGAAERHQAKWSSYLFTKTLVEMKTVNGERKWSETNKK